MTTVSYPLSEANFTAAQWRSVFDGQTGIIGADGSAATCLDLVLSATDNTATVKPGKLWYRGYVLEVTADDARTLAAAVGSAKTYSIGAVYNPAAEASAPLSLWSGLKTDVATNTPAGGSFCSLHEVTRQPSQILSLAAKVDLRRFLGPSIIVGSAAALPEDAPLGARVYDGADQWLRTRNTSGTGAQWSNLSRPDWTNLPITGSSGWTAAPAPYQPQYRREGSVVRIRGAVVAGTSITNNVVATIPSALRPSTDEYVAGHRTSGGSNGVAFEVYVTGTNQTTPGPGQLTISPTYADGGALKPNVQYPISGSFPL